MSILGIGPALAFAVGGSLVLVIGLKSVFGISIELPSSLHDARLVIGALLTLTGLGFWLWSATLLKRAYDAHRLETGGVYAISRNPLYAAFIVFLIPGIALVFNNLMLLIPSVAMFVTFRLRIRREEEYLEREFGAAYRQYAARVPRLIRFLG